MPGVHIPGFFELHVLGGFSRDLLQIPRAPDLPPSPSGGWSRCTVPAAACSLALSVSVPTPRPWSSGPSMRAHLSLTPSPRVYGQLPAQTLGLMEGVSSAPHQGPPLQSCFPENSALTCLLPAQSSWRPVECGPDLALGTLAPVHLHVLVPSPAGPSPLHTSLHFPTLCSLCVPPPLPVQSPPFLWLGTQLLGCWVHPGSLRSSVCNHPAATGQLQDPRVIGSCSCLELVRKQTDSRATLDS